MSDDPARISVSLAVESNCDVRKRLCPEDVTFWFETPNLAFDLHLGNDGTAETMRDLFAEAVEHFARMDTLTDEEIEAEQRQEAAERAARWKAEFATS